jgi:hypothetical protein
MGKNLIDCCKVNEMLGVYQTKCDRENKINSIVETLGDSNVIQIFVHSVTSLKNSHDFEAVVGEFEKLPERSLVIARPDDLVCVAKSVDDGYLQFLSSVGIGPKNGNVVVASESDNRNFNVSLSELLMKNNKALLNIQKLIKRDSKIVLNPFIPTR